MDKTMIAKTKLDMLIEQLSPDNKEPIFNALLELGMTPVRKTCLAITCTDSDKLEYRNERLGIAYFVSYDSDSGVFTLSYDIRVAGDCNWMRLDDSPEFGYEVPTDSINIIPQIVERNIADMAKHAPFDEDSANEYYPPIS